MRVRMSYLSPHLQALSSLPTAAPPPPSQIPFLTDMLALRPHLWRVWSPCYHESADHGSSPFVVARFTWGCRYGSD